jgi:putative ABC transport system substrate-binding protein
MSRVVVVFLGLHLLAVGLHPSLLEGPAVAFAQQAAKMPLVGFLSSAFEDLGQGGFRGIPWLTELGYSEGRNIRFEHRVAVGSNERLPALAAELVALGVDVIVTSGTSATRAAQQATRTIPIVMLVEGDPVKAGFVQSLGRPGGNITGRTVLAQEVTAKRLALLRELVPGLARVGVLWNPANPDKVDEWDAAQLVARQLGVEVRSLELRSPEGLAGAFDAAVRERCGGLLVLSDKVMRPHAKTIAALAAKHRIPAMYPDRLFVNIFSNDGLVSYGPERLEWVRSLATYVDRILKGAKPANLPVEQPTRFELIVNLKTAKAMGLAVPQSILIQADKVVE